MVIIVQNAGIRHIPVHIVIKHNAVIRAHYQLFIEPNPKSRDSTRPMKTIPLNEWTEWKTTLLLHLTAVSVSL